DLEQRSALQQHVDGCPDCSMHFQRLHSSNQLLQVLQPSGELSSRYRSVRLGVLKSLRTDRNSADVRRFNQLVASIALAAGLLAAVCISNSARLDALKSNPVIVSPFADDALPDSRGMSVPQTTVSFSSMNAMESNSEFQAVPSRTARLRLQAESRSFFDY
ncbi:MAG: hypothetical protein ABGZ17_03960, partial [Planctomycetaceae bacterium]